MMAQSTVSKCIQCSASHEDTLTKAMNVTFSSHLLQRNSFNAGLWHARLDQLEQRLRKAEIVTGFDDTESVPVQHGDTSRQLDDLQKNLIQF
jgi:hypothetical protein